MYNHSDWNRQKCFYNHSLQWSVMKLFSLFVSFCLTLHLNFSISQRDPISFCHHTNSCPSSLIWLLDFLSNWKPKGILNISFSSQANFNQFSGTLSFVWMIISTATNLFSTLILSQPSYICCFLIGYIVLSAPHSNPIFICTSQCFLWIQILPFICLLKTLSVFSIKPQQLFIMGMRLPSPLNPLHYHVQLQSFKLYPLGIQNWV